MPDTSKIKKANELSIALLRACLFVPPKHFLYTSQSLGVAPLLASFAVCVWFIHMRFSAYLVPVLMFGWGVPALGIAGAAWATTCANALGAGLGLLVLARLGSSRLVRACPGSGWVPRLGRKLSLIRTQKPLIHIRKIIAMP